jgi:hypothetical protein
VFENVNVIPYTWAELRFGYSTPVLTGTVSLGAWSLVQSQDAAGSFAPNSQLWFRDAFLTYVPKWSSKIKLSWKVGVYEDRYGAMAEYSTGQYGAPLIATIPGVGETLSGVIPLFDKLDLKLEHSFKGTFDRTPSNIPAGPDNNWPKPWEGETYVSHLHAGLDWKGTVQPTFHWIAATARDNLGDNVALGNLRAGYQSYTGGIPVTRPDLDHADGSLQVFAGDIRFALKRFGYLYGGASYVSVDHVRTISNVVQVLNAGGGRDLMDRYFGRNNDMGRGTLLLAGGEYSLNLGQLVRSGDFWGEGPDLKLTLYGMYARITSDDPSRDGEQKYKFGAEGVYSFLSWLAVSGRVDRSVPYVDRPRVPIYFGQNDNSFSVLTLKALIRSHWLAHEALTVQYSRFVYRENFHLVTLNAGGQVSNVTSAPDTDVVAIYGSLWW